MKTNNKQPLLSFEFATSTGEVKPVTFINPIKTIVANKIEDIFPCFEQIQEAVEQGFYAAGYVSYESAPAFDSAFQVSENPNMPLLWFGIFSEPIEEGITSNGSYENSKWSPDVSRENYNASIESIKSSIENGDTYQTNYTIRLQSQFKGDDIAFFTKLKQAQSSNYCAYINTGEFSILSASPELFFHLKDHHITTRPMKGTIARGRTVAEDEENAKWLYESEKNRAENVMIVDLLRNDLSVIAQQGTVQVPKLFEIEHYPTVHQMTSTITAKVRPNTTYFDLFKALFPCGSITGAPKISTMDIISKLEIAARDVYCGAIGYITPKKEAIFNVPIRTVVLNQNTEQATYGVGGGITWDSTASGEYEEVLTKASLLEQKKPIFDLLESILLVNGELFLLEEHLDRIQESSKYFKFPFNRQEVRSALKDVAKEYPVGEFKLRLLMTKSGQLNIEAHPLVERAVEKTVKLAAYPINKKELFLYHKTTNRDIYTQLQQTDVYDVLLWNEDHEITEFTNGNIVVNMEGILYTPPIHSGLLAGTFREKLLSEGEIEEKVLKLTDLENCSEIWFINSVRKWIKVKII
ncbi:aminodeoxychorismate synthase component I [Ureibacillus chungkukjangi]|uniref:Aminodeoxychorismate synthase subunit I /aminodeoxychorismate lyase apoprotein n=1 Tax=Ureibacillus chungkukjangi TaxID=1202712 RepID=A0A318TTW8_9BACL|nr:aminodeoxychorismate synthase component I [Ureibacillus chungkukjangi]PYF07310.1 aminodeoxychorismate synthase subunit I /aminodeoxychorismate lyase apoprotein [Ureibacillus chungkukjangi]